MSRNPTRDHLSALESEAVYVLREVSVQFERPLILFSGGKDSAVLAWLARKAFHPARSPFPLLHIDTGHNFAETLDFRDRYVEEMGCEVLVRHVQDSIDQGRVKEETGPEASRNALQTVALLDALRELQIDAAIGGARRDEEKARAKERFFSHRDRFGRWDPRKQRPELWNLFNGKKAPGEHFRVFPLSNWTEIDVWRYIHREGIPIPALYLAHEREVVRRDGVLLARTGLAQLTESDEVRVRRVRFRTVGDVTCTGAIESEADSVQSVIQEIETARSTERAARSDDRRSETAMEDRKREGYF